MLFILILLPTATPKAQSADYKYHCIFIMNFIKYIEWPSSALKNQFVIGVVDEKSSMLDELERITSSRKTTSGLDIVVKKVSSSDEAANCNLLFVANSQSSKIEEINSLAAKKGILLITEKPGLCRKGSVINFVMKDGKWKFELNKSAAEKAGLRVANELVKVSITV